MKAFRSVTVARGRARPRRRRHRPDHPEAVPEAHRAHRLRRVPLLRLAQGPGLRAEPAGGAGRAILLAGRELRLRLVARARAVGARRTTASRPSSRRRSATSSARTRSRSGCCRWSSRPSQVKELMERARARRGAHGRPRGADDRRRRRSRRFEIDPFVAPRAARGLDAIALTLQHDADIAAFEQRTRALVATTVALGRRGGVAFAGDLALRQIEELVEELAEPFVGQRAAVRAARGRRAACALAVGIDERSPTSCL